MEELINSNDSLQTVVIKMSKGNPGAVNVIMEILTEGEKIDPKMMFGGLGFILIMDSLNIYGEKIWMLFKDVCKQDLEKTLHLLRGFQLGFITKDQLLHAINNYGEGINVNDTSSKVKIYLAKK